LAGRTAESDPRLESVERTGFGRWTPDRLPPFESISLIAAAGNQSLAFAFDSSYGDILALVAPKASGKFSQLKEQHYVVRIID
jgi:hypothetical protein